MHRFLVTTAEGKTLMLKSDNPFKLSNSVKKSGSQPTLVLQI